MLAVVMKHGEENLLQPTVKIVYNAKLNRHVKPLIIDLSTNSKEKIISYEPSEYWGIEPELHLF